MNSPIVLHYWEVRRLSLSFQWLQEFDILVWMKSLGTKDFYRRLTFLIIALSAALRVVGAHAELWLDEVWSYLLARHVSSIPEIFKSLHIDNNHYLNTVYLYLLGDIKSAFVFRIPALLAGIGTLFLLQLWSAGAHRRLEIFLASTFVGFSSALLIHSTEARGYSLAIFFSVASLLLLQQYHSKSQRHLLYFLWSATCAAILSHLTAALCVAALSLYTFYHHYVSYGTRRALAEFAKLSSIPSLLLSVLFFYDLRFLQIGGGDQRSLLEVLSEALNYYFGFGQQSPAYLSAFWGIVISFIFLESLYDLWKKRDGLWVFYLFAILIFPIASTFNSDGVLYARYFILPATFLFFLLARRTSMFLTCGALSKFVGITIVVLYVSGNLFQTYSFLKHGRGSFLSAVSHIERENGGEKLPIIVGTEQVFRLRVMSDFYKLHEKIQVVDLTAGSDFEWLIISSSVQEVEMPQSLLTHYQPHAYNLSEAFLHGGPYGLSWYLYRRARNTD